MCYRTKLNSKIEKIERAFESSFLEPQEYEPKQEINGFDFCKTPVITNEGPGEIQMYHWGLIPFWAKDDKIKKATLNAKIETVSEKPAFRDAVKNRCLILADGYYEWQWRDSKGKVKQKYLIRPQEQEIFAFAGIYSCWTNPRTNEQLNSYSILTTEANEIMSEIHNNKKRMPVVLKATDRNRWLSGAEVANFAFPYEVNLIAMKI